MNDICSKIYDQNGRINKFFKIFSMSNFLSKKKNKEKYELNNRSEHDIGKDKEKEYGSITSLVNNEVRKIC